MLANETQIDQTNTLLRRVEIGNRPPVICLLTGSSGCGKTHLSEALAKKLDPNRAQVFHFDSIGVPSHEEMVRNFGSGEQWQEATTQEWIKRIAAIRDKGLAILEGQYHPRFAIEACRAQGIQDFALAVVTCTEQTWVERLHGPGRSQPELITPDMRNWAQQLIGETTGAGGVVIDTTEANVSRNMSEVGTLVNGLLRSRMKR